MLDISLEFPKRFDDLIARLVFWERHADKYLIPAMEKSVTKIEGKATKKAPVGVSARLKNSLASSVTKSPEEITGRVGSTMRNEIYPLVQEKGRKFGGKMPPPGALDRWVQLKLRVPKKKVKSVAFLIGRKLRSRGMVGKFYLRRSYFESIRSINRWFARALRDIAAEIKGRR